MGGLCNCFISNPNEIITLDLEIEHEKRRALKKSPILFEDQTSEINNQSNKNQAIFDHTYPNFDKKDKFNKQNSLDSNSNQKNAFLLLSEFNEARQNPSQYSEKIKKYSNYIKISNKGECYFEINKQKIIIDKGCKVFNECIEYLQKKESLPLLKMSPDLIIDVPYDQINDCDNINYINAVMELKKEELKGKYINLEFQMNKNINNPELSAIIQIINSNKQPKSTRNTIFNKQFSCVGINCFEIDTNVFCYYILFGEINQN